MQIKSHFVFILLALPATFCYTSDKQYCELESCSNGSHTLCRFSDGQLSRNCRYYERAGLWDSEKKRIIRLHEYYRSFSISREERNSSLYKFKWDEELEYIAQRWAMQCENVVDQCRHVERFLVEQRVDLDKSLSSFPISVVDSAISRWYNEERDRIQKLKFHRMLNKEIPIKSIQNHSDEIVWSNVNRIGCGAIRIVAVDFFSTSLYLVCNYGKE